jgi:2-amino-4-hydroxy-6-hydroxymethyldihydropteridine diphosphokinase
VVDELHQAWLNLGSNIEPEANLPKAILLLKNYGEVWETSSVWESRAVGSDGPNFLNVCILFETNLRADQLKETAIGRIEAELGRVRTADKNSPRTIDIDIALFDGKPFNLKTWDYAFVIVPLGELLPDLIHPLKKQKLSQVADEVRKQTWMVKREDVKFHPS